MALEGKASSVAELIQLMQDPDYKPYINKEAILKEWIRTRGFDATDIINSDGQAEQIKQQMAQQAAAMAQAQNVPTLRAEMSRPDALLEMLQNTDKDSPIYPAIYEQVALSQDAMNPSMKAALDLMKMQLLSSIEPDKQAALNELATKSAPDQMDHQQAAGYPMTAPQQQGEQQEGGEPQDEIQMALNDIFQDENGQNPS